MKNEIKRRADIFIRDPFILPVEAEKKYYMFGTTGLSAWGKDAGEGFSCYSSTDLQGWEGPYLAFKKPENFWADRHFWAPEVYAYKGKYYMFASFKSEAKVRGTQVLVSGKPEGPYTPLTAEPVTPRSWECLDGTLFIDDRYVPWIIFCHEWLQVKDGQIAAMRLTEDLKLGAGNPITLFKASEAKWAAPVGNKKEDGNYVTDGPFLYRSVTGSLLMLWSSFGVTGKYSIGIARSSTGKITGPWIQEETPLFSEDGGHGMIFKTFDGRLLLSLHAPNSKDERAVFIELTDTGYSLKLASEKTF